MHPKQPRFRLTRQAMLLGLISAAYPMTGFAVAAGQVDFAIGRVEAVTADGSRRALSKGSQISEGDAINTAPGARVQLRFSDGGFVSLQPNTVFRVDQYNFKNKTDGSEKGFFSLLKGSLRAITGSIGHTNRDSYKVNTATATIGIRGTGYKAELREDGLVVSVGEGAVLLSNNAGILLVTSGRAAFVASANTLPASTNEQPRTPPASIQPITSTTEAIPQLPALPKMTSGGGYTVAYAYRSSTINGSVRTPSPVNAVFNDLSQLIKYSDGTESAALGSAAVTFSATDGIIGWGRWDGNMDPAGSLSMQPGVFHYVVGLPTTAMPTSGTATYNLMGYTNPTATDASTGWNVKGDLAVTFSTTNVISVNMNVWNASDNYAIVGTAVGTGATFTGSLIPTTSSTCSTGCTTSINGFFAGANASRAGLSYQIDNPYTSISVEGVATFASTTPPPL